MPGKTRPLGGILVLDLTRMLPGAVLARTLMDLGADLVKVEAPEGDPFRQAPPLVDGTGAGFALCYRGARSVAIDLKTADGAAAVEGLARRADVLVESFRTGTLERWGLAPANLTGTNPRLVFCSISAWGRNGPEADRIAHDLDATARTGALTAMGGGTAFPSIQLADTGTGLLAAIAILAALLARERTGRGAILDVPLASGPLPFVSWAMAEARAGGTGTVATLLSGRCPCYRTYRCADGLDLAVGAIEPRLWMNLLDLLGLPSLATAGWDPEEEGRAAAREIAAVFATRPRREWLEAAAARGLPVDPVHDVAEAVRDPLWRELGLADPAHAIPGPWLRPPVTGPVTGHVPSVGEHTDEVLATLRAEG